MVKHRLQAIVWNLSCLKTKCETYENNQFDFIKHKW